MKKYIGYGILLLLIVIQFVRIDKNNPEVEPKEDFLSINSASDDVKQAFQSACYDCHSHQTAYPWYTNVAPVSWWIKGHINGARNELNFSKWSEYSKEKRAHKIDESIEEIKEGHMPPKSYRWMHREANWTDEQTQLVLAWLEKAS